MCLITCHCSSDSICAVFTIPSYLRSRSLLPNGYARQLVKHRSAYTCPMNIERANRRAISATVSNARYIRRRAIYLVRSTWAIKPGPCHAGPGRAGTVACSKDTRCVVWRRIGGESRNSRRGRQQEVELRIRRIMICNKRHHIIVVVVLMSSHQIS